MRFGRTLRQSIYEPWKDKYMDYAKLKGLLREDRADDEDVPWTEDDETRFCEEIFNVQLEKVAKFQDGEFASLKERVETAFSKLKDLAPADGKPVSDITVARLKELESSLDGITDEVRELKKYSQINYTGFQKIAKKHDRRRGDAYKILPLTRITLSKEEFNSERAYAPLLNKLSTMYFVIRQHVEADGTDKRAPPSGLESSAETHNGERYTAHKFWVHLDNLLEVQTLILRQLPALVYSEQSSKELDPSTDPSITSLYFDDPKFSLYTKKVENQVDAPSLRLRWFGQLSSRPELYVEQKVIHESGESEEHKFTIKDKYVKPFLDGEYKMEKSVDKMVRQGRPEEDVEAFKSTVEGIQEFVKKNSLEPVLRANYMRQAYQSPTDDRVRISIDTDIAFIREDTLDPSRPCRDPSTWHRTDIDDSNMAYPFKNINQSEVSKFPYAVLEIKLREDEGARRPAYVEELMASHLVHAAPRFSKFVHGVASLFEDYVNGLPFWLSDLEADIRKDPQLAFDEEEARRAQRAEDDLVVGSFLGGRLLSVGGAAGSPYRPSKASPLAKSYLSDRPGAAASSSGPRSFSATAAAAAAAAEAANRKQSTAGLGDDSAAGPASRVGYGTLSSLMPGFSLSKYARWMRARQSGEVPSSALPEGVVEPKEWLKNAGPLKIEPKAWLANERTSLKWLHIVTLLGTLATGLYMAAGQDAIAEAMGIAYIGIAVFAGGWSHYMHHTRRRMIMERSGKDFDNLFGPVVVSMALMIALILNLVFQYRAAFDRMHAPPKNSTLIVGELL